jgi:hypothetical protein
LLLQAAAAPSTAGLLLLSTQAFLLLLARSLLLLLAGCPCFFEAPLVAVDVAPLPTLHKKLSSSSYFSYLFRYKSQFKRLEVIFIF